MGIFMVWPLTWSIFTGLILETSLYVGLLLETSLKICMYMNIWWNNMGDCLMMMTVMKYMCVTLEHTTGTYKYIGF